MLLRKLIMNAVSWDISIYDILKIGSDDVKDISNTLPKYTSITPIHNMAGKQFMDVPQQANYKFIVQNKAFDMVDSILEKVLGATAVKMSRTVNVHEQIASGVITTFKSKYAAMPGDESISKAILKHFRNEIVKGLNKIDEELKLDAEKASNSILFRMKKIDKSGMDILSMTLAQVYFDGLLKTLAKTEVIEEKKDNIKKQSIAKQVRSKGKKK